MLLQQINLNGTNFIIADEEALNAKFRQIAQEEYTKLASEESRQEEEDIADIHEAAKLTGRAEQTIYGLVCRRQIPHSKDGKFLKFSKKKLREWMMQNERKTHTELSEQARSYLKRRKLAA
jgi:excisionase family DNA binding protein